MFGGLARRPEINPSSMALVVCHELGHAYAGAPYIIEATQLAAEGMADYYATRECYGRVYQKVPGIRKIPHDYSKFINEHCYFNNDVCQSGLEGARGLAVLLFKLSGAELEPMFETPDPYVTPETLLSYPATAQCRLDTYVAGLFHADRPACWFKD
jgi:hypothetical protein